MPGLKLIHVDKRGPLSNFSLSVVQSYGWWRFVAGYDITGHAIWTAINGTTIRCPLFNKSSHCNLFKYLVPLGTRIAAVRHALFMEYILDIQVVGEIAPAISIL